MTTLTIKLPAELKQRLELEARQSGRSVAALIREAVPGRLRISKGTTGIYDRTKDLCGAGASWRPGLATNPDHLGGFEE